MTNQENKAYKRQIKALSGKMMIAAYEDALKVTEGVYRDILIQLDADINEYLNTHKEE